MMKLVKVNNYQVGLRFHNEKLVEVLGPGWYLTSWILGGRIDLLSEKDLFVRHPELDEIVRTGQLDAFIEKVELTDEERALVWVDGRFQCILTPGRYAIWKRFRNLRLERLTVETPRFDHRHLVRVAQHPGSDHALQTVQVEQGESCLYFCNGSFVAELSPGFYAFWLNAGTLKFYRMDLREKMLEMSGQDIITADKVTLRLNAMISYRIVDAQKSIAVTELPDQSLYREGQLILRSAVGSRNLDNLLADKDSLAREIEEALKGKAEKFGLAIVNFGIRDIILPGDMRDLMNQVVEAQKKAEAMQITRREETAATRSQCNTAKMIESNPTLMRLRELEVVERIAEKAKLNLFVGEKGLTEKVVNLL